MLAQVLDPMFSTSWITRDISRGVELLKAHLGDAEFILTEGRGRLHTNCIKLNAVRKKRRARFADTLVLQQML